MIEEYQSQFSELLSRSPDMEEGLRLIVKRWRVKGIPPRQISISIPDSDYNAGRAWEQLGKVKSLENGKIRFSLGDALRRDDALIAL